MIGEIREWRKQHMGIVLDAMGIGIVSLSVLFGFLIPYRHLGLVFYTIGVYYGIVNLLILMIAIFTLFRYYKMTKQLRIYQTAEAKRFLTDMNYD
jgi:hypothetical protein